MATLQDNKVSSEWTEVQKIALRFFFVYFLIQIVPLDWKYYSLVSSIDWTDLYYGDIFNLSRYYPKFFAGPDTLLNWVVTAFLASAGATLWSYWERSRTQLDYDKLYYWLRVILRYRLAFGVIAFGFIKLFPLQAPFPSLSNLNTSYGDNTTWKMFSLSLGVAPTYEVFLGAVEIFGGLLLLSRKTASIGAFIILSFAGNVFLSNLAYEGGEAIYSLLLTTMALFLFAFDFNRLVSLLSLQKVTQPNKFKPSFADGWQKNGRLVLKGLFVVLFVGTYGIKAYNGYKNNPHNVPVTQGLKNAAGLYNVKQFIINGDTLPYSLTNQVRWKDVVFEKWATISIRSKRPVRLDTTDVEVAHKNDFDKIYELSGSGGRHYYHYEIDSVNRVLTLKNKNRNHAGETLVLHYERPNDQTIILKGADHNKDTIQVLLERNNKKYLLIEGRRKAQTL